MICKSPVCRPAGRLHFGPALLHTGFCDPLAEIIGGVSDRPLKHWMSASRHTGASESLERTQEL